jgi:hypothetical protein
LPQQHHFAASGLDMRHKPAFDPIDQIGAAADIQPNTGAHRAVAAGGEPTTRHREAAVTETKPGNKHHTQPSALVRIRLPPDRMLHQPPDTQ